MGMKNHSGNNKEVRLYIHFNETQSSILTDSTEEIFPKNSFCSPGQT